MLAWLYAANDSDMRRFLNEIGYLPPQGVDEIQPQPQPFHDDVIGDLDLREWITKTSDPDPEIRRTANKILTQMYKKTPNRELIESLGWRPPEPDEAKPSQEPPAKSE